MKPKLTDSQWELARISNMPTETAAQCAEVRKYEKQCLADTVLHEQEQREEADEQTGA